MTAEPALASDVSRGTVVVIAEELTGFHKLDFRDLELCKATLEAGRDLLRGEVCVRFREYLVTLPDRRDLTRPTDARGRSWAAL